MYKERLDQAWKKVHDDWVNGTMELAITLWEAKEAHKALIAFGDWLTEQGYGKDVINHQNRSALINMGALECREIARKILWTTRFRCWENIWSEEIKPEVINSGLRKPVLRPQRKTPISTKDNSTFIPPTIAHPPAESKPELTEREMLQQLNEKEGYEAWITIENSPEIGRMPDNAKERFYHHIKEINQHCHELFQLSLYTEQMNDIAKLRLAVEFKGIKKWGEVLAERMLGHKRLSQISAPMCDIEAPFRKLEN